MKKAEKPNFTPTFFWEDMTYVLKLIWSLLGKLFGFSTDGGEEGED